MRTQPKGDSHLGAWTESSPRKGCVFMGLNINVL